MRCEFRGGDVDGNIFPPSSKSLTHRAIFMASLARGTSEIGNALASDDIGSTIGACRAIGADIRSDGNLIVVEGGDIHAPRETVDVGNSGTTLRIYAGICSSFGEECTLVGDDSIMKRPMGPLLDALESVGVSCSSVDGHPPIGIKGPNPGGRIAVDGSVSSQFVTSLLMAAPLFPEDSEIHVTGEMVSAPYLESTICMMRRFGADVRRDGYIFRVKGGDGYSPCDLDLPPDFSSAAFPLAAGALGGRVSVGGLDRSIPQGDSRIADILRQIGADVSETEDTVTVGKRSIGPVDLDMSQTPDLFPVTAVVLCAAEGTSRLYGAPHLRLKESDRIASTAAMLNALGGDVEETDDGCIIHGRGGLDGGEVSADGDHRIAMSAAVASVICDGPVTVDDAGCCSISYPGFLRDMDTLGIRWEECRCSRQATHSDSHYSERVTRAGSEVY